MGGGNYSSSSRAASGRTEHFKSASVEQTFKQRTLHPDMNPRDVVRECRDSEDHPNSLPIIIGLDVTASMSYIPAKLIGDGLPQMMDHLIQAGLDDSQVCFIAIGDHECDSVPLQVGQFEQDDQKLDHWLTNTYLERGGGGNGGESYLLAWEFANHTDADHWHKRDKRGYLFTIGDEPNLPHLKRGEAETIFGGQHDDRTATGLLAGAQKQYHVYHIHVTETARGRMRDSEAQWSAALGDNLLIAQSHDEIPELIASTIAEVEQAEKGAERQNHEIEAAHDRLAESDLINEETGEML